MRAAANRFADELSEVLDTDDLRMATASADDFISI
jgi:hypothetical protein